MHTANAGSNEYQKDVICLSKHFLHLGASSSYLNPPNKEQGFISRLGKPVRYLGRGAYAFGIVTLAAPAGAVYHIFQGIACYFSPAICQASLKPRAFGHWNAALEDGKMFLRGSLMTAIGVLAIAAVAFAFSQKPVEGLALGALVSYLPLYKCNPISHFMFSPNVVEVRLSEPIIDRYVKRAGLKIANPHSRKKIDCLFAGVDLVKQLRNLSSSGRWLLQMDEVRTQAFHDALKSYCERLDELKEQFKTQQVAVRAFLQLCLADLLELKNLPSYAFLFKAKGNEQLCRSIEKLDQWVQKKEKLGVSLDDEEKSHIGKEESKPLPPGLDEASDHFVEKKVESVEAIRKNEMTEQGTTKKNAAEEMDEKEKTSNIESDDEEVFEEGLTYTSED